ncbi:hypothetical protein TNCV_1530511 [Trichonephila clavipes]|uniref:Histone-lysine N-methyltransferase SETMAR n=1 Tax=Trichonephila clavipes TaxID=2585209 RepID=A0A8X6R6X6_TRICX|nr:hypothetical protein TNCV_1530511 [Trichonephila clavipes]
MQTGCRKPQYGGEGPAKFFNDRNQQCRVEEVIQNDRRITLRKISSQPGLSYGRVQCIFFEVLRYSKRGQTINEDRYCVTLTRLREAIRLKRPGMLREGVIFLHDNARPHIAQVTQELL